MFSNVEKTTKHSITSRNETVARLAESLKRREELASKAVKVVESLIDNPVSEARLQDGCKHINQFYYKDLIEERAVVFNCGYPLCSNKLKEVKRQQFHISVKHNKVFDITERKNFCSNICFKASKYLENQLSSAELWLKEVIKVKFLPLDAKSGIRGVAVDLGDIKPVVVDDPCLGADQKTQEDEFVEGLKALSLSDSLEKDRTIPRYRKQSFKETLPLRVDDGKLQMKPKGLVDKSESLSLIEVLERTLKEWLTLESAKYLFDSEKYEEFFKNVNNIERSEVVFEKVQTELEDLCRKLDIQAKEDEILDRKIIAEESRDIRKQKRVLKKPPCYDELIEDRDKFVQKVEAFYEGSLDVPLLGVSKETKSTDNFKVIERNDGTSLKEDIGDRNSQGATNICLPVVNHQEQLAIRRMIVLEKLKTVCSAHLQVMGFSYKNVVNDFRMLVHTFRLTAMNISFKPTEWLILTIVMLKLLTFHSVEIRDAFTKKSTIEYVTGLLEPLNLDTSHLNELVDRVLNADSLTTPRSDLDHS